MATIVIVVFLGMSLGIRPGGLPFRPPDRTGVALPHAIAWVGIGARTPKQAAAVHPPTILRLFAFMVIAARMRRGGFVHLGHTRAREAADPRASVPLGLALSPP